MDSIRILVLRTAVLAVLFTVLECALADGSMKRSAEKAMGLCMIACIAEPIIDLFIGGSI